MGIVSAFQIEEKLGVIYDATPSSSTKMAGEYINVTKLGGLEIVSFNISKLSTANKCYILDTSNNTLYSGTITSNNCTLTTHPRLEYGTEAILFVNKTVDWNRRQKTPVTYPISNSYFYFRQGVLADTNYSNYAFEIDAIVIDIYSSIANNVSIISQKYNSSSVETKLETFILNITANGTSSVTASLIYNGTDYGLGTSSGSNSNLQFTKTINVPDITSLNKSQTFFWNITWNGITDTLQKNNQFVNKFLFGLCNTTISQKILNISFKDETTDTFLNATLDSSSWIYNIGGTSKTSTLINNSHNWEYDFCIYPVDLSEVNVAGTLQYSNSQTGTYPQRKMIINSTYYNTTLVSKILYLLNVNNGITSNYQVISVGNAVISGATILIQRIIGSSVVDIASGTTDNSGSLSFFLNPNYAHTFYVSALGYSSQTQTITPSQTSYTFTMGTSTNPFSYTYNADGIYYTKWPPSGIVRNGVYNFTYEVYSIASNIYNCTAIIYYNNGTIIAKFSGCNASYPAMGSGGLISKSINITDMSRLRGSYYITTTNNTIITIETDASWRIMPVNSKNYWTSMRSALNDSIGLSEWGDNPDTADYSRLVFFFIFFAIVLAGLNFFTSYDTAYPGAIIVVATGVVVTLSLINGPLGPGFFYLELIKPTSNSSVLTGFEMFWNNWILAIHFIELSFIYLGTTLKRYQA